MFGPKYKRKSVKLCIPPKFINDIESDEFWPQDVYCKRWLGQNKWT